MRPKLEENKKRNKSITCRGNEAEVEFINSIKKKYSITIRELILLGIKAIEEQPK